MPEEIIDIRRTTPPPFFIRYFSGMGLSSTNLKNITLWDCKSWVDGRIAIRNPQIGWTNFIVKLLFLKQMKNLKFN